jgi:hypothetical protein
MEAGEGSLCERTESRRVHEDVGVADPHRTPGGGEQPLRGLFRRRRCAVAALPSSVHSLRPPTVSTSAAPLPRPSIRSSTRRQSDPTRCTRQSSGRKFASAALRCCHQAEAARRQPHPDREAKGPPGTGEKLQPNSRSLSAKGELLRGRKTERSMAGRRRRRPGGRPARRSLAGRGFARGEQGSRSARTGTALRARRPLLGPLLPGGCGSESAFSAKRAPT